MFRSRRPPIPKSPTARKATGVSTAAEPATPKTKKHAHRKAIRRTPDSYHARGLFETKEPGSQARSEPGETPPNALSSHVAAFRRRGKPSNERWTAAPDLPSRKEAYCLPEASTSSARPLGRISNSEA